METTTRSQAKPRPPGPKSVLIVEEALHSMKGHWFEYVRSIVSACRDAGDTVSVIAHKEADPQIIETLQASPMLPRSAWDRSPDRPPSLLRYLNVGNHNQRLYHTMDLFLGQAEKVDCLLAPTILIHHLVAWNRIAYKYRGKKFGRMVLIFITGQGIYQGPEKPPRFSRHPKTACFRFLLRRLKPLVDSGEVLLATETERMAEEYQDFCGLPFQCLPHPVRFTSNRPPPAPSARDKKILTFTCLGFARHEKGSDLLQYAILSLRQVRPDLPIRFLIQWLDDFRLPNGKLCRRHPDLLKDPNVQYITRPLNAGEYEQYLTESDAAVLPYRASSYYGRVSRVAIEAAISGIPLIYTRGTWLEEMISQGGAGVGFRDENVDGLVSAIIHLAENNNLFKARAKSRSQYARDFYSPERYRACLLRNFPLAPAIMTSARPLVARSAGHSLRPF